MGELVGQTVGQYQIVERLGRGGMADVYKAFHPGLAVHRALKVIRPEFVTEEGFKERFQQEARAIAALRHSNIVQIHDFGTQDNLYYMVMEFIEGSDLKTYLIERGQIRPFSEVVTIIEQVASALSYAHNRGVVHRDIKPGNIMLTTEGQAILTDFGIAKMVARDERMTQTGVGIGTPAYMAPEQARGLPDVGPTADVYSLGIVLYEMLTGKLPYSADTPLAVMLKVVNDPMPPPRTLSPDIPDVLQGVILKATTKDPAERYPTADALADGLKRSLEAEPGAVSPVAEPIATGPVSVPTTEPRRIPWLPLVAGVVALAIGGLCVLAGVIYFVSDGANPTPTSASALAIDSSLSPTDSGESTLATPPTPTNTSLPADTASPPTDTPTTTPRPPTNTPQSLAPTSTPNLSTPVSGEPFFDDFNGPELNSQRWTSITGDGQIQINDSSVRLMSSGRTFPYIYSQQNPFPVSEDFSLKISLQYLSTAERGVGFRIGTFRADHGVGQNEGQDELFRGRIIEVWQDSNNWHISVGEENTEVYVLPAPELNSHVVEINYVDKTYHVILDGQEVYMSSSDAPRPTIMWFGNPAQVDVEGLWSSLEVMEISVEAPISVTPTPTPLPPTNTPIPVVDCASEPQGVFRNLWVKYKNRLGCPHQIEPIGGFYAEQPFQNGHMFWSKAAELYLIVIGDNSGTWWLFPEDESPWKEGMPQLSCEVEVPAGLLQPVRGFGGLWCAHADIREQIGWGTAVESGFEVDLLQGFEGGIIFRDSDGYNRGVAYILFWDDTSFVKDAY